MSLSPLWVDALAAHGIESAHWSTVGDGRAPDEIIMGWARDRGYVVFTHDLDFGAVLALTAERGPSVIQVRTQDVTPQHLVETVIDVLREHGSALDAGAIVSVDEARSRVRILPLRRNG